jgi:hypothetical protein
MRILALFASLLLAPAVAVPRGKRAPRPLATHVVVRATEIHAEGVVGTVAPGVAAIVAGKRVTLVGPVEITGTVESAALGQRVAADTEVFSDRGEPLGRARAGAFVVLLRAQGKRALIDTVGAVHARLALPAAALTAEPRELVYPEPTGTLVAAAETTALHASEKLGGTRARVDAGGRIEVIEEKGSVARVHTYGEFELDGWMARDKLVALDKMAPLPARPSRGLNPNREALADAPLWADAAGKKPIGTLHGGALVTLAAGSLGDRAKVMTHGDVVIEVWTDPSQLRPVDAAMWSEGP